MNPLQQLAGCGQSPWLDFVRRSLIDQGELARMVAQDGLKGVTSNPSIFEKGIADSHDYDTALAALLAGGDRSVGDLYEALAVRDIQDAADALRPVHLASHGADGHVSLEVSPYLANDAAATIAEAHRLAHAVDRPNLMVKVPATKAGIVAIRQLAADGLNINVTLLFAVDAYQQVAEAWMAGLEARVAAGLEIGGMASVASFFVSRIDSAVDAALDGLIAAGADKAALAPLRGRIAIANAKAAYHDYLARAATGRWQALAQAGAHPQRLLWASTSTKSPALPDTLYVDALIGRDTVNTLPPATMDAFRDHGTARPDAILDDPAGAQADLAALTAAGVDLDALTDTLLDQGVAQFSDSFDSLLGAVARQRLAGLPQAISLQPGLSSALAADLAAEAESWRRGGRIRALWGRDPALWQDAGAVDWLGWLDAPATDPAVPGQIAGFAQQAVRGQFADVVLLGMGGSSLGPLVIARVLGQAAGWPAFHMLDSINPDMVGALLARIDPARTLVIVASKSGSTLESSLLARVFRARIAAARADWPAAFVAITDPGSALARQAEEEGWSRIFFGDPTTGGRFSVLSVFGLVPAACMGVDLAGLLAGARAMAHGCGPDVPPSANPAVQLGLALAVASRAGRDKLTLLTSPSLASFGLWLEQLVAESTGKNGGGMLPVVGEGAIASGADRLFVRMVVAGEKVPALSEGQPALTITLAATDQLGGLFFLCQMATAVAGVALGINPFDQPDVEAAKLRTRVLSHSPSSEEAVLGAGDLAAALPEFLGQSAPGDYIAILAYLPETAPVVARLEAIRAALGARTGLATTLGFGPRYLHSTGQLHKGGSNRGLFLVLSADPAAEMAVPDGEMGLGVVARMQARGDAEVLAERGRRLLRAHFRDPEEGLQALLEALN